MKRSLVILIAILIAVLFYTMVMLPLGDKHQEMKEELEVKVKTLAKYRALVDIAPETEVSLKEREGELEKLSSLVFDVESDAVGFSRLNGYIQNLIGQSGMEVISIKQLSVIKYKLYTGLPLQINAKADVKRLSEFLRKLADGQYLVSVDSINVRVMNIRKPEDLRLKIELSGYREL